MDQPSGSPPVPPPQADLDPLTGRATTHRPLGCLRGAALMGAIALPVIALLFELASRACADILFDPLPTWFNVVLVACVPIAAVNMVQPREQYSVWHTRFVGFAIGICAAYCLPFAPSAPMAVMGILAYGLGLLPLAPFIGFVGLVAAFDEARQRGAMVTTTMLRGMFAGLAAVVLSYTPSLVTDLLTQRYFAADADERPAALTALRRFGSTAALQARIDGRGVLPLHGVGEDAVIGLLYRVTGESHRWSAGRGRAAFFDFMGRGVDRDQGGETVGALLEGLELADSRLAGHIAADEGHAYFAWEFAFESSRFDDTEARFEIALPAGACVSRATLWVQGVEREATFAPRSLARAAYSNIVRRNYDPLLVSSVAADRVLVQCFPIRPDAAPMRIRIGITAPLDVALDGATLCHVPSIASANFVRHDLRHEIDFTLTGRALAAADGLVLPSEFERTTADDGATRVTAKVRDSFLAGDDAFVRFASQPERQWTPGEPSSALANGVVVQSAAERTFERSNGVVVVLDTSRSVRRERERLVHLFETWPDELPFALVFAGDAVHEVLAFEAATPEHRAAAVAAVRRATFAGGIDAERAVARAFNAARELGESTGRAPLDVLWLHGEQLHLLDPRQDRGAGPWRPMLAFDLVGATNVLVERFGGGVTKLPTIGDPRDDLEEWVQLLARGGTRQVLERRLAPDLAAAGFAPDAAPASKHVLRLFASDKVTALVPRFGEASGADEPQRAERAAARDLAVAVQVVTPLSSAVVLETDEMTRAAGLETAQGDDVPVLPEPQFLVLLAIALVALVGHVALRRP